MSSLARGLAGVTVQDGVDGLGPVPSVVPDADKLDTERWRELLISWSQRRGEAHVVAILVGYEQRSGPEGCCWMGCAGEASRDVWTYGRMPTVGLASV